MDKAEEAAQVISLIQVVLSRLTNRSLRGLIPESQADAVLKQLHAVNGHLRWVEQELMAGRPILGIEANDVQHRQAGYFQALNDIVAAAELVAPTARGAWEACKQVLSQISVPDLRAIIPSRKTIVELSYPAAVDILFEVSKRLNPAEWEGIDEQG